jgi:hypothetical protein
VEGWKDLITGWVGFGIIFFCWWLGTYFYNQYNQRFLNRWTVWVVRDKKGRTMGRGVEIGGAPSHAPHIEDMRYWHTLLGAQDYVDVINNENPGRDFYLLRCDLKFTKVKPSTIRRERQREKADRERHRGEKVNA